MEIKGNDFDSVFRTVGKTILDFGIETSPRGQKIKELINPTLTILNPLDCVLTDENRKLSEKYLKAEFDWYASGLLSIEGIKDHSSMWERLLNPDGETVNSNYGFYTFYQPIESHDNQFEFCLDSLEKDEDSRQALINFNQPQHKFKDNKDFVCTISQQFMIRDNELITIINMRSCDLIYGAGYDIPWFAYVQYRMFERLKETYPDLTLGRLEHNAGSLHVYERHFEMLRKLNIKSSETSKNLIYFLNNQLENLNNLTEDLK